MQMHLLVADALPGMGQSPRQEIEPLHTVFNAALEYAHQLLAGQHHIAAQLNTVRTDQLCRRSRRRRAHIGGKIGDGEIGFMPHAADHRHRTGADRPGHHFFVVSPQILNAAAAAADDQHITLGTFAGERDRLGDFGARAFALDRRRINNDVDSRHTPPQRGDDIAQRGGLR